VGQFQNAVRSVDVAKGLHVLQRVDATLIILKETVIDGSQGRGVGVIYFLFSHGVVVLVLEIAALTLA